MGLFDKVKDLAKENAEKVEDAVGKVAGFVDEKTHHKHSDQIDSAAEKAKGFVAKLDDGDENKDQADPAGEAEPAAPSEPAS